MIMERRKWQLTVIGGLLVAGFVGFVIMGGLQSPDNALGEGEDDLARASKQGSEFGASGLGGSGIIGEAASELPTATAGVVEPAASNEPATSAAAPVEEDPSIAFERERKRRDLEAILAEEAAAREAKNLAHNGVIGQGLYQPEPGVLNTLGSGDGTVPSRSDSGLEASLDPELAGLGSDIGSRPLSAGKEGSDVQTSKAQMASTEGSGPDVGYLSHGVVEERSPFEIKKGSVIPATLITEVNSDLPGAVTAQVRDDVYDTTTGGTLLIPKGARLYGQYDSGVEYGQRRAVVLWSHLIFPDGSTLLLEEMMGADVSGRSGFADKRRGNFLTMLAGNLLFSVLDAGERAAQAQLSERLTGGTAQSEVDQLVAQVSRGASSTGGASAASVFNAQTSGTKPTLMIRTGYRFNILVGKDIVLEPWGLN